MLDNQQKNRPLNLILVLKKIALCNYYLFYDVDLEGTAYTF